MRTLAVEFCGIPGSGKSTLCDRLAEELARDGITVRVPRARIDTGVPGVARVARKTLMAIASVARAPSTAGQAARVVRAQVRKADGAGRALQWLVTQRLLQSRAPGITLLDEGLVQALWSVALRGDLAVVVRGLTRVATPDLVVVVECTPAAAAARLRARGSEHSRVQTDELLEQALARGVDVLEHILAQLPSFAPATTVRRLSEGTGVVRAWIDEQLGG